MAAILIAGLFSSCEKDSETPETPETPETETYRTHLAGDWYVTKWYGYTNVTENSLGDFYSFDFTETDNFIISFDEDGTMTQNHTSGSVIKCGLDFDDIDSEVQFGEEANIYGNFIFGDGNGFGYFTFESEESLKIYMDSVTTISLFECKRKL